MTQVQAVPQPAVAKPPKDVYANLAKESGKLVHHGRMFYREVKIFLSNQYDLIRKHDTELFPVVLVASAVSLLFVNNLLATVASFALGSLFAIAKGDKWANSIIIPVLDTWAGSNIGKIGIIAVLILIVAPLKWDFAAFGLGIYAVQLLRAAGGDDAPAQPPAAPPALGVVPGAAGALPQAVQQLNAAGGVAGQLPAVQQANAAGQGALQPALAAGLPAAQQANAAGALLLAAQQANVAGPGALQPVLAVGLPAAQQANAAGLVVLQPAPVAVGAGPLPVAQQVNAPGAMPPAVDQQVAAGPAAQARGMGAVGPLVAMAKGLSPQAQARLLAELQAQFLAQMQAPVGKN